MAPSRTIAALLVASLPLAGYACDYPPLVQIPLEVESGRDTDRLRDATQEYVVAMTAYTECIQAEISALGDTGTELHRRLLVTRNNQAVAEVEAMMRIYEERVESREQLGTDE